MVARDIEDNYTYRVYIPRYRDIKTEILGHHDRWRAALDE